MNAESEKVRDSLADQLANFDDQLHATADDVDILSEIQKGIGELLNNNRSSEKQVRRLLQDQYNAGSLRKETYQLVKSMLDHYATENVPTSPLSELTEPPSSNSSTAAADAVVPIVPAPEEDNFGSTTIIPADLAPQRGAESRGQVGSVLRDRYLLQEKVAGGSMGVVYKALDRRLAEAGSKDHWVAIKVLSPQLAENRQALRALQQEAAKGRCLVHPNIVRFIDIDREDELYFLIMEWLEGRTLADILDSGDSYLIDRETSFRIVREIGDALDYAHRCGIVHADIKPGNIMITPDGDAKLFDFGVARVRQQHADAEFDPGILGALTPAYSSMQVLTGEDPVASDDVFSLSCLLYRLMAGHRVFGPRDAAEASQEGMTPQRLKQLNEDQWRALKKGLSYSRVTRFDSVREFLDALGKNNAVEPVIHSEPRDRFVKVDEGKGSSKTMFYVLTIIILGFAAVYRYGDVQPLIDRISAAGLSVLDRPENEVAATEEPVLAEILSVEPEPEPEPVAGPESQPEAEISEFVPIERPEYIEAEIVGPDPMLVDFSKLPAPTHVFPFTHGETSSETYNLTMREDGGDVIVDFIREQNLSDALTIRLEEVGFSGNRSPWASGQFEISNSGLILIPAGQKRGRITLSMSSDEQREPDQQSTLRLRDAEFAESRLATVNVTLEDDDQRDFELGLMPNTVSFAASQISVKESSPAVQIDLIRYNPDEQAMNVNFDVISITASQGSDYFAPLRHTVAFGPGQRAARLFIPLVQDLDVEGDEAFVVELVGVRETAPVGVAPEVIVTIEDDETQIP